MISRMTARLRGKSLTIRKSNVSFTIHQVCPEDDLQAICTQMQPSAWGADNEMGIYSEEALRAFLAAGGLLLLAYDVSTIAGVIVAHILPDPTGKDMLFIFSLDTHPKYRRQGVATQLMTQARAIADAKGLIETWVIADADNEPANKFYATLHPTEAISSMMYAYKVK